MYILHDVWVNYVLKKNNKVQLFCKVDKQNGLPYLYMCYVVQVNFIQ